MQGIVALVTLLFSLFPLNFSHYFQVIYFLQCNKLFFCQFLLQVQSKIAGERCNWSLFLGIWLKNRLPFSDHKGGRALGGREVEMHDRVLLIYQRMKVVEYLSFPKHVLPAVIVQYLKTRRTGKKING